MSDEAIRLLRWYVESDLIDGGDEYGAWDDQVREFVNAVWESADYCGCCGNEITDLVMLNRSWCAPCSLHISPSRFKPVWERTYEAVTGSPCPFQASS